MNDLQNDSLKNGSPYPTFLHDFLSELLLFVIAAPIGVGIAVTLGLPPKPA